MECKINSVEVKVGQTWRQRDGDTEIIASFSRHNDFPIQGKSGATYDSNGRYSVLDGECPQDLVELISEAPVEPDADGWYAFATARPPKESRYEVRDTYEGGGLIRQWRYVTPDTGGISHEEKAAVTAAQEALTANAVQHGGDHYKSQTIQPWDYIASNGLGYFEGNVVKYVSRWRKKGGLQDLRKAQHYLQKLIEVEGGAQ